MNSLEKAMSLIAVAGDSKSYSMEAVSLAKEGKFDEARASVEKARDAMITAHDMQTDLIRAEVEGRGEAIGLLMVHAQDHLSGALLMRELAEEFIDLYKKLEVVT
ncbi:MAG: PTS lactose/cellobiose transporter subunit IIA [Clostridiales Family XIII bacterium]|jgi:PTS system cellobiose-specific IIA component|nr:PTS lactose/cellobiose transporter subunit IIA [Clostridiales Family XIII bacterium]